MMRVICNIAAGSLRLNSEQDTQDRCLAVYTGMSGIPAGCDTVQDCPLACNRSARVSQCTGDV